MSIRSSLFRGSAIPACLTVKIPGSNVTPMKKRLVTSALPYVNNIPHLGNLIQVLSADVFARYCRQAGYETLYICGTDEYGTATETRAREEGISPKELCDRFYKVHREIYEWFGIQFDNFGRTSKDYQTRIVQDIFRKVHAAGYISQHSIQQLYSEASDMFLADRYVKGTCPACGYTDARGDQCESCGKLLDPSELINPLSVLDNTRPVLRETTHLYLNLPEILPKLEAWMKDAAVIGKWAKNAIQMTNAWIRDGLKERAITRDLKWGIPVPLEGFENKVFYVWFDAPIGYISITAEIREDWERWWKNPDDVELFQFIGKDNIPFHTVIFPSSLLATGEKWTMLHHMSSSEYLNYESGKFSKSKGIGVFGNDVQETGIPADVWRFYIFYNRPETSDYVFTWKDFQEKVNKELIGNFSNLVNRTLSFVGRFLDGNIPAIDPAAPGAAEYFATCKSFREKITAHLEWAELRDALRTTLELSGYGNKVFQEAEPWKLKDSDPALAGQILARLAYLVRDLAILIRPYLPATSDKIAAMLGVPCEDWKVLGATSGLGAIGKTDILFASLDDKRISALREKYSGSQADRASSDAAAAQPKARKQEATKQSEADKTREEDSGLTLAQRFAKRVDLRVAKIAKIERHPAAEKLYVETLDDGSGAERVIVSGLVPHYAEEELLGKHIILVNNLRPAKLRGVQSAGMLLAVSRKNDDGDEKVEVIEAPWAVPGTRITLEKTAAPAGEVGEVDIDTFFDIPIECRDGAIVVGGEQLQVDGRQLRSTSIENGPVG